MGVGRDHIASTVNTLVLAYAGASIPLLLLFSNGGLPFAGIADTELVAEEIVTTLAGSFGLIAAVPLTTALAVAVVTTSAHGDQTRRGRRGASSAVDEDEAWLEQLRTGPIRPPRPM